MYGELDSHIQEEKAMDISATGISRVTESVMTAVNEWRSRRRPLEAAQVRKTIYTANPIEEIHHQVRKITKPNVVSS